MRGHGSSLLEGMGTPAINTGLDRDRDIARISQYKVCWLVLKGFLHNQVGLGVIPQKAETMSPTVHL